MTVPPINALERSKARAIDRVFDLYDPPVWLVTAGTEAHRGGLIATFVVRASIVADLPRVVLGVAKHHHTWGLIERGGQFVLHLLHPAQMDLVWRFGLTSGHSSDKLGGLPVALTPSGQPRIETALAWLDCRVETRMDSGDRTIYLAAVTDGGTDIQPGPDTAPLTVSALYAAAPPAERGQLDAQYVQDGRVDAEAILAWRGLRSGAPA